MNLKSKMLLIIETTYYKNQECLEISIIKVKLLGRK
jgi:hypothetical protein